MKEASKYNLRILSLQFFFCCFGEISGIAGNNKKFIVCAKGSIFDPFFALFTLFTSFWLNGKHFGNFGSSANKQEIRAELMIAKIMCRRIMIKGLMGFLSHQPLTC